MRKVVPSCRVTTMPQLQVAMDWKVFSTTFLTIFIAEMGPVVAANAGPGTVGAALFQPAEEELPLIAPLGEAG